MLLSGEPGIGKTRLATELAREAHADGATVLYGRCDPESLVPYQPFVTARPALHRPARDARRCRRSSRPSWPSSRASSPRCGATGADAEPLAEDGETRRYRLFEAVTRLLAFAARERPVVLVLDDLHWADTSTALLLAHLLRDGEPVRLLVLGTIRDADGHRSDELPSCSRGCAATRRFERSR